MATDSSTGTREQDGASRRGRGLGYATRVQVSAHQFMARRASLGMTRRRVRMESEPGRREWMSMLAGISLVVVICLGALLWSFIRPAGSVGSAKIVSDQQTGALYVRVNDRLYPALNLASARLIAGDASDPVRVRRAEIESRPRGPMVGIPGAPNTMVATSPQSSSWLVCDAVTKAYGAGAPEPVTVTVIDGQPDLSDRRRVLEAADGVFLRYGDDVWLVRDGHRSLVDARQRPVVLALGVSPEALASARPMSRALLDAIPVAPPLVVPLIPGIGGPAGFAGAPGPVGTVVSTPQVQGNTAYSVVLMQGMQTVSPIVAQIIENSGEGAAQSITVAGSVLASLPSVNVIDTSPYPDEALKVVDTQSNSVTCWWWQRGGGEDRAQTSILSGPTLPIAAGDAGDVVTLVKADKSGGQADQVYFAPNYANYVVSTGNSVSAQTKEALWWVSESGVRLGVARDEDSLRSLGLSTPPNLAPWAAVQLLAPGPVLSKADALVRHDALPMDLNPGELEQPR